jgi:hypothetical protein
VSKKTVKFKAELITNNARCRGFIKSFSKKDIYFLTSNYLPETDCCPESPIELKFTHPEGEKLNLSCKIKWAYKTPPVGFINIIAEVVKPFPKYQKFLRSLHDFTKA